MHDPQILIESLDHEARGVGHVQGKVVFVEQALPGETVRYRSREKKRSYEIASLREVVRASPARVVPRCPSFGRCGGCSMQHIDSRTQVAVKQRVLEDNLARIGKVRPEVVLRPVQGPAWHYRYRARLSVRFVSRDSGVLIGFHERKSSRVTDMKTCAILPAAVSALLVPLRVLVGELSIRERLPQIELAAGDDGTALLLRILAPLTLEDEGRLARFAAQHDVEFWLQSAGPESARPFGASRDRLHYEHPAFATRIPFQPTDFMQINPAINRILVAQALRLLDPGPEDRVGDFFCGLGNFTLPLGRRARAVVGIEGSRAMTARARENARANGLAERVAFQTGNLFQTVSADLEALGRFDKILLDPPREGAVAVCKALALAPGLAPDRIVYVSCNPSTLARDASILVHEGGYRLVAAGVVNMFPHTSHVESIAVLEPSV